MIAAHGVELLHRAGAAVHFLIVMPSGIIRNHVIHHGFDHIAIAVVEILGTLQGRRGRLGRDGCNAGRDREGYCAGGRLGGRGARCGCGRAVRDDDRIQLLRANLQAGVKAQNAAREDSNR